MFFRSRTGPLPKLEHDYIVSYRVWVVPGTGVTWVEDITAPKVVVVSTSPAMVCMYSIHSTQACREVLAHRRKTQQQHNIPGKQ